LTGHSGELTGHHVTLSFTCRIRQDIVSQQILGTPYRLNTTLRATVEIAGDPRAVTANDKAAAR